MAYQTGSNVLVAARRETTAYTIATVTGASRIRIIDSPGLELKRATIESAEKRSDGLVPMGRLGYKSVDGSYNVELSTGGAVDLFLAAVMRNTWSTALAITAASMTNITVGTSTVANAGATSWITAGIRVGDIFHLANYTTTSSNGINAEVISVDATTIMVPAGTFATAGAACATCTFTRLKKVVTATATLDKPTFSIEQYDQDIDLSEVFIGCKVVGVRLSFRPGEMAQATFTFLGTDRTAFATGTSPYFTPAPSLTTTLGLVADDSSILKNGAVVAKFTGFELEFAITAKGEPVIGSLVTPAIFDNDLRVTGSITGLREDFANLTAFDAETEFALAIKLEEPTGSPPECLALFVPRVKFSAVSAPVGGGDGAKIETLQLMVGPKASATGYDASIATFSSSAA